MTYTTGIPTAVQSLGQTQQSIQDNFTVLDTTITADHVQMNLSGQGRHNWCRYQINPTSPPTTGAAEIMTYSLNTLGLFLRLANGTTDFLIERNEAPLVAATGYTWLPGNSAGEGLIIQWGRNSFVGNTLAIVFPKVFGASGLFSVATSAEGTGGTVYVQLGSEFPSGFTAVRSANTVSLVNWIAIGRG